MPGVAFVQNVASGSGSSVSTLTLTVGSGISTTPGNMLSLGFRTTGGATVTGIADSLGNTWQIDEQGSTTHTNSGLASCIIQAGKALVTGSTITITCSASNNPSAEVEEYSGVAVTPGGMPVVDKKANNFAPQGGTGTGVMGVTLDKGMAWGNLGANVDAGNTTWGGYVYTPESIKIYLNPKNTSNIFPVDGSSNAHIQACIDQGLTACIHYYPAYDTQANMNTDLPLLINSITKLKALIEGGGGKLKVGFYNEVDSANTASDAQYLNAVKFYVPSVRALVPFVYQTLLGSTKDTNNIPKYWPGPPNLPDVMCDEIVVDYYVGAYKNNFTLDEIVKLATDNNVGFGMWEYGSCVGKPGKELGNTVNPATGNTWWVDWMAYLTTTVNNLNDAGIPLGEFIWFQANDLNPPNIITVGNVTASASGSPSTFTISGGPVVFQDAALTLSSISGVSGFSTGTVYYVVSVSGGHAPGGPSATFQLATTMGGSPIGSGSGTVKVSDYRIPAIKAFATTITTASSASSTDVTVTSASESASGDLVRTVAAGNTNGVVFTLDTTDSDASSTWTQTVSSATSLGAGYQVGSAESQHSAAWSTTASSNTNATMASYVAASGTGPGGGGTGPGGGGTGPGVGGIQSIILPDNLLTLEDSGFEYDTDFTWTAETSAGTPVTSSLTSFDGSTSLSWTSSATAGNPTQVHSGLYPVVASQPYIASLWMNPATSADCYMGVEWYDDTSTLISTSTSDDLLLQSGLWQPLTITTFSPPNAAYASVFAQVAESTSGDVEYIDLVYLASSPVQILIDWFNPTYINGTVAGNNFMDVSPFVRFDVGVQIQSGRQDAISDIQAGSVNFTLQNDDGLFTRFNSSSPINAYDGSISTQKRLQVNFVDETGNWWTRADGLIAEIDYTVDPTGNTNQAAITGTDILSPLNRQDALECWTKQQVLRDNPQYHWSLNDEGNNVGSGVAAETSGNNGPPLRLIGMGTAGPGAGATLTWQDSSGGVETLASAVAADHPDGSEYWIPGQVQPTSPLRGLDAGVQGTYTITLPSFGSIGAAETVSIPFPSINMVPILNAQSAKNTYIGNQGYYLQGQLPEPIAPNAVGTDFSVEIWYTQDPTILSKQTDNYGPFIPISLGSSVDQSTLVAGIFLSTDFGMAYYNNPPAWLGRNFAGGGTTSASWSTSEAITLDTVQRPHHVVLTFQGGDPDMTVTLYLDGSQVGSSQIIPNTEIFDQITVGSAYGGSGSWYGNLSLCSIYPLVLSQSTITNHCMLGQYGMWEQTTDNCIAQLAAYANIPPFWNNVSAQWDGLSQTDYQDVTGSNALSSMQQYFEVTEKGLLFIDRSGRLNFHTRDWRMGYGEPDLYLPPDSFEADLGYQVTDQFQVNEQAVNTNSFSAGVSYVNQDSQAAYGTYAIYGLGEPATFPLLSWSRAYAALGVNGYGLWGDPNLIDNCAWEANTKGEPWLLPGTVTIDVLTIEDDPAIELARSNLFALEIDNMIAPVGTVPASFPNEGQAMDWFIEGINETFSVNKHTITFYTSPALYQRAWKPGDSVYGVLGSTTRLGISGPDLNTPQADGKDVSHDAGPPYWIPTFETGMNNPAQNGHDFIGMSDLRGLVNNLQNAMYPPIAAVSAFSQQQTMPSGANASPQIFWDTIYVDSASGMGIIPEWPNWYCVTVPGWYEIDAQLVWTEGSSSGGSAQQGWIVVAQAAAQAVAAGTATPTTVNQYVCPIGETVRLNADSKNSVCAPATRMYLGLGDMVTLAGEQDTGGNWQTGIDFGASFLSLRFLGIGTTDDRVNINTDIKDGGSVTTPPTVGKHSTAFLNTDTYAYWGSAANTDSPNHLRNTNIDVYQGEQPNQNKVTGSQYSQVVFDVSTIRTDLTGATITGLTLTCKCIANYYTTGSNLYVGYFVDTPGSNPWVPKSNAANLSNLYSQKMYKGQTKTFNLPLTIAEAILNNANGLWIGDDSATKSAEYGEWNGGAGTWTLTFHYTT